MFFNDIAVNGIPKQSTQAAKAGVLTMDNFSSRPGDCGRYPLQISGQFRMEHIQNAVSMAINQLNRTRDAIYLDTNAWSMIARQKVPIELLATFAEQHRCVIWLARMQLAELSARRDVIESLANVLEDVPVVVLDREQHELDGAPWHKVKIGLQEYVKLRTPELREEFIRQFAPPALDAVRAHLVKDRDNFRDWLNHQKTGFDPAPRDWTSFPPRVERWIRQICAKNNRQIVESAIKNPDCYAGVRLAYAVLFSRYYINNQDWQDSDYLDYLHAADMAYAKIVVTERNLAECIRQATRRPEVNGPEYVYNTAWLRAPNLA